MDNVERYVSDLNINHFLDTLEKEPDGPMRSVLKNLLLREENRFAKLSERLETAENCLSKCARRIREQRDRIAGMDGNHPHLASAKRLLANMLDIHAVVQAEKDRLKNMLD